MLGPNCWTLLILSILYVSTASDEDAAYCKNGKISVKDVTDLLSVVNERRTNLAKGLEKDDHGHRLPPAKNMRKMVYDCTLEHEAESLLNVPGCTTAFPPQLQPQKGISFSWYHLSDYQPLSRNLGYLHFGSSDWDDGSRGLGSHLRLIDFYWGLEVSSNRKRRVQYMGDNDNALYYANLMRGSASKIGCAVRNCSMIYMDLCLTDEKNIQIEDEIYEIGSAETCKCDKPLKCDGRLCIAPVQCPGSSNGGWVDIYARAPWEYRKDLPPRITHVAGNECGYRRKERKSRNRRNRRQIYYGPQLKLFQKREWSMPFERQILSASDKERPKKLWTN